MDSLPLTDGVRTVLPAPPGYDVDFDNPTQRKALENYVLFGIGGVLSTAALGQRYYTKLFLSVGLKIDDALMLLAWMCGMVTQSMNVYNYAVKIYGVHAWEMPVSRFEDFIFNTYVMGIIYQLCNSFTKLSLLAFYLQLSPKSRYRYSVFAAIGMVFCYTVIITTLLIFQCNPVDMAWSLFPDKSKCMSQPNLFVATGATNIVTDVVLFFLPMPMVLGLHMSVKKKIGALIIFGIGTMWVFLSQWDRTVVISCLRLSYVLDLLHPYDATWEFAPVGYSLHLEANLFVICGSMPTIRKFCRHFAPRLVGKSSREESYPNKGSGNQNTPRVIRNKYHKFADDGVEMTNLATNDENHETSVDVGSVAEAGSSSQAIMQTRTFEVQYN